MKRKLITYGCIALFVTLIFFPITTVHSVSGEGQVRTTADEILGDCELSLEIKEVKSLLFCYKKSFSFVLDGHTFSEFVDSTHDETSDGLCLISQMYYDKEKSSLAPCSLAYRDDLSNFVLRFSERLYILEMTA